MYNDASMLLDGNFDDPRLTDYELLNRNLSDLKAGKTIEAPIYDFKQSKRTAGDGTSTAQTIEESRAAAFARLSVSSRTTDNCDRIPATCKHHGEAPLTSSE